MKAYMMVLMTLSILALPVFAEDLNTSESNQTVIVADVDSEMEVTADEVGALPGDLTYGFKRFFENVDKFFTFDKTEKAKKYAQYGQMRAMEAHLMTKKAQLEAAEGNADEAERIMAQVEGLLVEQGEESENAQAELEAAVEEGSADEGDVEEVEAQLRNSIMVLQRVYEKAPESAKDGLAIALNNSINNQERHEEKLEEKNTAREEKKTGQDESEQENRTEAGNGTKTESKKPESVSQNIRNRNESVSDEVEIEDEEEAEDDHGKGDDNGKKNRIE